MRGAALGVLAAIGAVGTVGTVGSVRADDDAPVRREVVAEIDPTLLACLADRLWPEVPAGHEISVSDQIADTLGALGNSLGGHLSLLSKHYVGLRVDGRGQRARVLLGGGTGRFLELRLDSDIHFDDGLAKVKARLDLGLAGHAFHLELPEVDMSPESYAGATYVELRLPLFRRSF